MPEFSAKTKMVMLICVAGFMGLFWWAWDWFIFTHHASLIEFGLAMAGIFAIAFVIDAIEKRQFRAISAADPKVPAQRPARERMEAEK